MSDGTIRTYGRDIVADALEECQEIIREKTARIDELEAEIDLNRQEARDYEKMIGVAQDAHAFAVHRVAELEAENEVLREQNIGMVDDYIEARARIAELESALHEATAAITDDSSGIYAKMERKIGELEAELDEVGANFDSQHKRANLLEIDVMGARQHIAELEAELDEANRARDNEREDLYGRLDKARAERDRLQEQAAAYESCNRARQAAEARADRLAAVVAAAKRHVMHNWDQAGFSLDEQGERWAALTATPAPAPCETCKRVRGELNKPVSVGQSFKEHRIRAALRAILDGREG